MKQKLMIALIISATYITANAQYQYPMTKWDITRLFLQYVAIYPEFQNPDSRQEHVTGNYFRAKAVDSHPGTKNIHDVSVQDLSKSQTSNKDSTLNKIEEKDELLNDRRNKKKK
ncbi:MAG TPA: hypothetical protein VH396_10610 [Chitinophagaceae bacterium]|jgi:hypothetical protein